MNALRCKIVWNRRFILFLNKKLRLLPLDKITGLIFVPNRALQNLQLSASFDSLQPRKIADSEEYMANLI